MSRNAKLSFVREDIYDRLKGRITVGMKLGVCQLSKLYAYNGLSRITKIPRFEAENSASRRRFLLSNCLRNLGGKAAGNP